MINLPVLVTIPRTLTIPIIKIGAIEKEKENMKNLVVKILALSMVLVLFVGCGSSKDPVDEVSSTENAEGNTEEKTEDGSGSVYFLNFKPEIEEAWQKIAKEYTELTGVEVKVVTAAAGTYEQTLRSEIAKSDAPTLFQINGPVGYEGWKNYTRDLSDTDLYSWLLDKSLVVTGEDGGVYGIPYVVEGYGIIYNDEIMSRYFALENKNTAYASMDEINNYAALQAVVEDMTALKDELNIQGVFASTSFSTGEDWRWQTHLANLPIYYEFTDKGVGDAAEIDLTYGEQYKNIFDLYINNSITKPTLLSSKTVNDSMAEFALGQVAMVQNGNWGWGQINGVDGNVVAEENVKFLPIYTGVDGEEAQGLCTGTENFFSINAKASEADQQATIDFVEWLFSSEEGKGYVTNDFGFIAPFNTFAEDEVPTDPLAKEVLRYMADDSLTSVSWNFTAFPSQQFKDVLGYALLDYAQGTGDWENVEAAFVDGWKNEKAATAK